MRSAVRLTKYIPAHPTRFRSVIIAFTALQCQFECLLLGKLQIVKKCMLLVYVWIRYLGIVLIIRHAILKRAKSVIFPMKQNKRIKSVTLFFKNPQTYSSVTSYKDDPQTVKSKK